MHFRPANQAAIGGVALRHKKTGDVSQSNRMEGCELEVT